VSCIARRLFCEEKANTAAYDNGHVPCLSPIKVNQFHTYFTKAIHYYSIVERKVTGVSQGIQLGYQPRSDAFLLDQQEQDSML
jgi:hypothetical protein